MKRRLWIAALVAVLCVLIGVLYASGFFRAVSSVQGMQDYIRSCAPYSHLAFFAVQLLSVILAPIPSNISAAAGGVLFGTWTSFLLTAGAVLLGSVLVFQLARTLGKSFADRFVSRRLSEHYLEVIRAKRDTFLVLAFLFPFFPDDVLCVLAGLTDIPFRRYLLIVVCARFWGLLFASALGGASLDMPLWGMLLIGMAGVAVFLLGMRYGDVVRNWLMKKLH